MAQTKDLGCLPKCQTTRLSTTNSFRSWSLLVVCLGLFYSAGALAQSNPGSFGLGLHGYKGAFGPTAQLWMGEKNALKTNLQWAFETSVGDVALDYERHFWLGPFMDNSLQISIYLGVGASMTVNLGDGETAAAKKPGGGGDGGGGGGGGGGGDGGGGGGKETSVLNRVGIRVPLGASFRFAEFPVVFFCEVVPYKQVYGTGSDGLEYGGAFGARYFF